MKYFDEKGNRYKVKKYKEGKKLKLGNAYIIKKYVIPYRGEYDTIAECNADGVGIYYCKETESIKIIRPFSVKKQKKYSKDNIYELDLDYMTRVIASENISSSLDDNVLELDTGEVFAPEIVESDNMCQRVIKDALRRKNIDLKAYANRFSSPTNMGNHKRALLNHGMNTDRFLEWAEILDIDIDIIYKDKEGCTYPMGGTFTSKDLMKND